jgi:hypothetical protein
MRDRQNIDAAQVAEALHKTTSLTLTQPFDMARSLYALAVCAGLIEHSLIGSARFGRDLRSLEMISLGPWARQV